MIVPFFVVRNLSLNCLLRSSLSIHFVEASLFRFLSCVLPLPLCRHYRSALPHETEHILHPRNRRPIPKNADNAKSEHSAFVTNRSISIMSNPRALLHSDSLQTSQQPPHIDGSRDHGHFSTQALSCASIQFLPLPCSCLGNTIIEHAFKAPKRILTGDAPRSHLLQSEEGKEIAEIFGSSDRNDC